MLFALWKLWRRHGHLSEAIIHRSKNVPARNQYYKRFGSLTKAYQLIGFKVDRHPYSRKKQGQAKGLPSDVDESIGRLRSEQAGGKNRRATQRQASSRQI
jgi:hypothetical protein